MTERTKILIVCRQAPYGSGLAKAALDVALAAAAFDQELSLLFLDDGVWQLLPGHDPADINQKNINATLESMPLYDINQFYVGEADLTERQLSSDDLQGNIVALTAAELGEFLDRHDQVLSF
jgi:tRNA 2-thiouridine synthesizing protein C